METTNKLLRVLLQKVNAIHKLALKNQIEIDKLKKQLLYKSKPLPIGAFVSTDNSYEWGLPTIRISPSNWKKIKSGKTLKLRGQGWRFNDYFDEVSDDQFFHWDYWDFQGGINKPLIVTMVSKDSSEVVYNSLLYPSMIKEFQQKPKSLGE